MLLVQPIATMDQCPWIIVLQFNIISCISGLSAAESIIVINTDLRHGLEFDCN